MIPSMALMMRGPSPRIRGEFHRRHGVHYLYRTIPANTGRITLESGYEGDLRDHPREYGENHLKSGATEAAAGPSPRIRGELGRRLLSRLWLGTIPANTGRMVWRPPLPVAAWDHPREYGENTWHKGCDCAFLGPSPRIRGECRIPRDEVHAAGTIPANTGRIHQRLR